MIKYTPEILRDYTVEKLNNLRTNALRLERPEVVSLCDLELQRCKPQKMSREGSEPDLPVYGFHFVCPRELGVSRSGDGTFSTGIWVVATAVAERALAVGAYVALHENRSEHSYRQGTIKGWRPLERVGKANPNGIEFSVEPTNAPMPWRGLGSGEKGYFYGEDT